MNMTFCRLTVALSLMYFMGCHGKPNVIWKYDYESRKVTTNELCEQITFPAPYFYSQQDNEIVYFSSTGDISHILSIEKEYLLHISDDGKVINLFKPGCISCAARIPVKTITSDNTVISTGEFNCIMYPGMEYSIEHKRYLYTGGITSGPMRIYDKEFRTIKGAYLKESNIRIHNYEMTNDKILCTYDEMGSNYNRFSRKENDSYVGSIDYNGNVVWRSCLNDLIVEKHFSVVPASEMIVLGYANTKDGYTIRLFSCDGDEIYHHKFKGMNWAMNSNLMDSLIALYDFDTHSVSIHNIDTEETRELFSPSAYESGYGDDVQYSLRDIKLMRDNHIVLEYVLLSNEYPWAKSLLFDSKGEYIGTAIGMECKYNRWNPMIIHEDKLYKCVADSINMYIEKIN